ncbi:MAG: shikimate dehydrogenase [Chloroflexi bacterium]|nr:shikimate dehydrogenase [Chloroflexota bacterium]
MPIETFIFIGVSTGQSSIMMIFPRWAKILGLTAKILGRDIPLNAPPASYRRIANEIREDPAVRGALVTAHKIDLLQACRDMFDFLDPHARICDEVSCIAKVGGLLHGFAKDTISSGLALDHFVPADHWEDGRRDVLCFGAGGAATAISVCMAERSRNAAHPRRFLLVDIVAERLDAIRRIHDKLDTAIRFDYYLQSDFAENDALMRRLPEASLVINATGMGKDRPGSPITDAAPFPQNSLVWELNYRGERQFMRQAKTQAEERDLTIEDGWNYFLHGWTGAIAEVFEIEVTDRIFKKLAEAAETHRPAHHRQEKI